MMKATVLAMLSAALALPVVASAHGGRGHFDGGGYRGYAPDRHWSGPTTHYRGHGFGHDRFVERRIMVVPRHYYDRPYNPYAHPNRYSYRYYTPNRYNYPLGGYREYRYDYRPSVIIRLPPIIIR